MQALGQLGLHRETSSQRGERERWREGRRKGVIAKATAVSVRLAMVAMSGDSQQVSVAVASTTLT